jgi:DNA repair photolyase
MAKQLGFGERVPLYLADERPTELGVAKVSYSESGSLLTPGSGFMRGYKFVINPYSGCGFGCEYCYARFFAPTTEERDTWGRWVKVKQNAGELIRKSARARKPEHRISRGDSIYMSSVTDPYQPLEGKLELTREVLEALVPLQPRLTIQTRSPLATRDIDLFRQFERIRVNFTVTTDCDDVRKRYEGHCPSISQRLAAAAAVGSAGVPIGVSISPMLPIVDPLAFGAVIRDLNAAEYVTQYFKDPRTRFSAGSTVEAIAKAREDGWGRPQYEHARDVISAILGSERPLLEGMAGYAPPP